ncbi:MAG: histidine phosphatase family protein [Thermoanaerobaculia bacterium]
MKQLLILRHAKSDWKTSFESDHDRPLAKRGTVAARLMGRFLTKLDQEPDLILSSTAERARQTAELAKQSGDWDCPLVLCGEFYGSSPAAVLSVITAQEAVHSRLLLTGHEPTWSQLVGELTGGGEPRMPTAAIAKIDLPIDDWADLRAGQGTLSWLVSPKLLLALDFDD